MIYCQLKSGRSLTLTCMMNSTRSHITIARDIAISTIWLSQGRGTLRSCRFGSSEARTLRSEQLRGQPEGRTYIYNPKIVFLIVVSYQNILWMNQLFHILLVTEWYVSIWTEETIKKDG